MKRLFFLFLPIFFSISAIKAQDTEFWFVAPDIDHIYTSGFCDTPTRLILTSHNKTANVTISYVGGSKTITKTIQAGTTEIITFAKSPVVGEYSLADIENQPANSSVQKNKFGIRITSDNPIYANYQADGPCLRDLFTLKGSKALGKAFFLPFQNQYALQYASYPNSRRSFHIVATENNTTINVNLRNGTLQNCGSATTLQINLNAGETWAGVGSSYTQGLYGTNITSNKNIAVTVLENTFNGDMCGDQLVSVDNLGKNYVVLRTYSTGRALAGNEFAFVIATQPTTKLTLTKANGTTSTVNLAAAGDMHVQTFANSNTDEYYVINADKPVYVYQLSGYLNTPLQETGASLLPSMYSIQSKDISFFKPNDASLAHYIFVITHKDNVNNFLLNGSGTAITAGSFLSFNASTGMGDWRYLRMSVNSLPNGVNNIKNLSGAFSLGYMFGSPTSGSYGYLSGFGDFQFPADTIYACKEGATLSGGYAQDYKWEYSPSSYNGPYTLLNGTTSSYLANIDGYYALEMNQDPNKVRDTTYVKLIDLNASIMPVVISKTEAMTTFSANINPAVINNPNLNITYQWTFIGGTPTTSTASTPTVTWSSSSERVANLTITATANSANSTGGCSVTLRTIALDNISDADCYVKPSATIWDIERKKVSNAAVHYLATPLVGDIDKDGRLEVIAPGAQSANTSSSILIFNDSLELKRTINTPNTPQYGTTNLLIGDVNNDGFGEIIIGTSNMQLMCYSHTGAIIWGPTAAYGAVDGTYCPSLITADINGDGYAEILAVDKIYDGTTGALLVTLPVGGRGHSAGGPMSYMPVIADIDNDGVQEVVAGRTVYKISITNRSNANGNSATVLAQMPAPFFDGYTSVADIDLDGDLDVIVTGINSSSIASMYVWDGATPTQIGNTITNTLSRISRAFVGDITGTGTPDIAYTYTRNITAYSYNSTANTFDLIWNKATSDNSGATTMSMFDFDQDGEVELVYRDETDLRIINKAGNDTISFPCFSGTHTEYPVVVDLDKDGHADILVSGGLTNSALSTQTYIMRYGSQTPYQWASARPVWNQHAYNSVNINDDLSIPRYPLGPATTFPGINGTLGDNDDVKPFNNFLQQQTALSREGTTLWITPNGQVSGFPVFYYDNTADSMTITLTVRNTGNTAFLAPFFVTTYFNNIGGTPKYTHQHNNTILAGDSATISFGIPRFKEEWASLPTFNGLVIQINDNGNGFNDQLVCDSTNRDVVTGNIIASDDKYLVFKESVNNKLNIAFNDILPANCLIPVIQILSTPTHTGTAIVNGDIIEYTPAANVMGDTLRYSIHCANNPSEIDTATVFINIVEKPDNVTDTDCYITPPGSPFSIKQLAISNAIDTVYSVATPLVGDIDNDGIVEIVTVGGIYPGTNYNSTSIRIFKVINNQLSIQQVIRTPNMFAGTGAPFCLANVDDNGYAAIFVCTMASPNATADQMRLIKYVFNGSAYSESARIQYSTNSTKDGGIPFATDFNGDGRAEIVVYDRVFDAKTLTLLANGGILGTAGMSFGEAGYPSSGNRYGSYTAIADLDGDGLPEIAAGDCVYKVNIVNTSSTTGNSFTLWSKCDRTGPNGETHGDVGDGGTAVADFDGDGLLDVAVTVKGSVNTLSNNGSVYIWNPRTKKVIHTNVINNIVLSTATTGPSVPFIGDIDKDGEPEICLTSFRKMYAFDYNANTKTLTQKWVQDTSDGSACTTMSMFDFNQDGFTELVYRDETDLRIMNGNTGTDIQTFPVLSGTYNEYPVVADVNGDGAAEIIVTGCISGYTLGRLWIFSSDPAGTWGPARKVWNQFQYNAVNVNEDLTIPRYQLNPATRFPGEDGVLGNADDTRPYNAFLQQQTALSKNGTPVWLTPDAFPIESQSSATAYGDSVAVKVCIANQGNAAIGAPIYVSMYKNEILTANLIGTISENIQIMPGDTACVTFSIPDITIYNPVRLIAKINDNGNTFIYQPECDTTNNSFVVMNPALNLMMKKEATLQLLPPFKHNGSYGNPVAVLYGEEVEYKISALNANLSAGQVIIRDTVPLYMDIKPGSIIPPVTPGTNGLIPARATLEWVFTNLPSMDTTRVSFTTTLQSGVSASQPLFINKAWVTVSDTLKVQTNSTFHQGGGISIMVFSAGIGGHIYNSGDQALDYMTSPESGVIIVPEEGYHFAGWSHDNYVSLRGKTIEAKTGITHYDTLTVYGNVELRANFEPEMYPIDYYLNGGINSASNPATYSIESGAIILESPQKVDDIFIGWSGSNGEDPQQVVSIPEGSLGKLEYYANYLNSGRENDIQKHNTEEDKIWAAKNELYIKTSKAGSIVRVYTIEGVLRVAHTVVTAGESKMKLPTGIYAVTLNNGIGHIVSIE